MHAQLHYMMFQYRGAELRRAGERARLATEVTARRRRRRARNPIIRSSAELWRRTALDAERTSGGAR
jgi:hypothetical protein